MTPEDLEASVQSYMALLDEGKLWLLEMTAISVPIEANKMLLYSNSELEENNKQLGLSQFCGKRRPARTAKKKQLFCNLLLGSEAGVLSTEALDYLARLASSAERMQQLI